MSLLKDLKSDTNQNVARLKGAYSINLRKLARSDEKFSSLGYIVEKVLCMFRYDIFPSHG
jgi:hypothetical protein